MSRTASCRCGAEWRQRGNITGHCSGCHQTFEGIDAFDHHQRMLDEAPWQVCLDPATITDPNGVLTMERALPMVVAGADKHTWRFRLDPDRHSRLERLRERGLAPPPEGHRPEEAPNAH